MFIILILVLVSLVHVHVKTHEITCLQQVSFIVCQLYLKFFLIAYMRKDDEM